MKLPKTRIKIVTQGKNKRFYPQYRNFLGLWINMIVHEYPWYGDIDDAKYSIDSFLMRKIDKLEAKRQKKLPKTVECIKYP